MARKQKKKKPVREVDPNKVLSRDLQRVALWTGISVVLTGAFALVIENLR
ncbi:hypothetical protein [Paludifilum halophilum]|nr:hypothetical protein [Paludifilum halophilum]